MQDNLANRLKQIQKEVNKNYFDIEKLRILRQHAKNSFDKRINKLLSKKGMTAKIKVPESFIKLWKHNGKRVQIPINWRYLISSPFIYGMFIPSLVWHVCIEIYHQVCFRLYGIPLVDSKKYFIYDRKLLSWLNFWEKVTCVYCSYVNNLIRYRMEIGGRTERYWCPIKYYRRVNNSHSQYDKFIDEDSPEKMRLYWENLRNFDDLK